MRLWWDVQKVEKKLHQGSALNCSELVSCCDRVTHEIRQESQWNWMYRRPEPQGKVSDVMKQKRVRKKRCLRSWWDLCGCIEQKRTTKMEISELKMLRFTLGVITGSGIWRSGTHYCTNKPIKDRLKVLEMSIEGKVNTFLRIKLLRRPRKCKKPNRTQVSLWSCCAQPLTWWPFIWTFVFCSPMENILIRIWKKNPLIDLRGGFI